MAVVKSGGIRCKPRASPNCEVFEVQGGLSFIIYLGPGEELKV